MAQSHVGVVLGELQPVGTPHRFTSGRLWKGYHMEQKKRETTEKWQTQHFGLKAILIPLCGSVGGGRKR